MANDAVAHWPSVPSIMRGYVSNRGLLKEDGMSFGFPLNHPEKASHLHGTRNGVLERGNVYSRYPPTGSIIVAGNKDSIQASLKMFKS